MTDEGILVLFTAGARIQVLAEACGTKPDDIEDSIRGAINRRRALANALPAETQGAAGV